MTRYYIERIINIPLWRIGLNYAKIDNILGIIGLIIHGGGVGSSYLYFSFPSCSFAGKRPGPSSFLLVALIHFHGLQDSAPWTSPTMVYLQFPPTSLISGFSFSGPFKYLISSCFLHKGVDCHFFSLFHHPFIDTKQFTFLYHHFNKLPYPISSSHPPWYLPFLALG